MLIDPAALEPREFYQHLTRVVVPRPIGWISTTSPDGVDNVAPYSFFNAVCARPPTVFFSGSRDRDGNQKHSARHALARGEFVVNIVQGKLGERMNATSGTFDEDVSEFDAVGLTRGACEVVGVPRVAEADVSLECRVSKSFDLGDGGPMSVTLVFGEIVRMHVSDAILGDDGRADPDKLDALGRMGGSVYTRTQDRLDYERPG